MKQTAIHTANAFTFANPVSPIAGIVAMEFNARLERNALAATKKLIHMETLTWQAGNYVNAACIYVKRFAAENNEDWSIISSRVIPADEFNTQDSVDVTFRDACTNRQWVFTVWLESRLGRLYGEY